MARRYRYEYRQRKKARQKARDERRALREERIAQRSDREKELREVIGWVVYILVVVLATYFIVTYVGQRTRVSGDSMEATLHDGDNLIVDKLSYRFRDPERYEIIVFPYRYAEDTYYIKRIIGLPGETIQIIDGYVYIDGEKLNEHYGLEVMVKAGIAKDPIELGDDEYFVLGDNRNESSDSRETSVGVLHREDLIGRAWARIWPLSNMGIISHE